MQFKCMSEAGKALAAMNLKEIKGESFATLNTVAMLLTLGILTLILLIMFQNNLCKKKKIKI